MCEHANKLSKIVRNLKTTRHYELNTPVFVWIAFQILQFELSCFMAFLLVWMYGKLTVGGYLYASVKLETLEDLLLTKIEKKKQKKFYWCQSSPNIAEGKNPVGEKCPGLLILLCLCKCESSLYTYLL